MTDTGDGGYFRVPGYWNVDEIPRSDAASDASLRSKSIYPA